MTAAPASDPTGQMTDGRGNHTATPLADGRVLLAGGFGTGVVGLATAELYDPRSRTFSPTGSMATAHDGGIATLLSDGRVLVNGGLLPTAELY
ncbi:MAG: kelch repeat-containing protein, partial [Chloroflexota bacterium]